MAKNTVALTDKVHSKLGASSSERWLACPASIQLSVGVEKTTSSYAVEGTAAHELAEICLKNNKSPFAFIGKTIYKDVEVNEEMAESVQLYIDTVMGDMKPNSKLIVEHPFQLKELHPQFFGTNDACILDTFKITVYDFKYGQGKEVEAEENPQLMYYGIGAESLAPFFEEIELVIVQPRIMGSNKVKRWTTTYDKLDSFKEVLVAGALATEAENPTIKAGSHCTFCPINGGCKTRNDYTTSELKKLVKPLDEKGRALSFPELNLLTPDDISKLLMHAESIKRFLDDVRGYAQNLVLSGTPIEGQKLVYSQTRRKLIDDDETIINDLTAFGINEDDLYNKKFKGLGELASLIKSETGMKAKEADEVLDRLCTKPEPNLILAPVSDKRMEQTVKVIKEHLFKKIT